ncbi:hypothetical protein B0H19DRAFT_1065842 [Mycena capillaripes]|nr:hypothetical protein B0H19DRAFT_1065842 [Mycena capillaripes]
MGYQALSMVIESNKWCLLRRLGTTLLRADALRGLPNVATTISASGSLNDKQVEKKVGTKGVKWHGLESNELQYSTHQRHWMQMPTAGYQTFPMMDLRLYMVVSSPNIEKRHFSLETRSGNDLDSINELCPLVKLAMQESMARKADARRGLPNLPGDVPVRL